MILFLGLVLFAGIVLSWLWLSQRRIRGQIAQQRKDAIAAFNANDYSAAAALFASYLARSHTQESDAEALFDYGKSRMNSTIEGNRRIFESIGVFERYLQLSQANDPRGKDRRAIEENEARHLLLNLYSQAHDTKKVRERANKILAANPNDIDALQNLVRALQSENNAPAALEACRKLNQLLAPDLEWQIAELKLLSATGMPADKVVARAKELQSTHPNEATFEALLSWADLAFGNDPAGAKQAAEAAANMPPGKAETVLEIVRLLDLQQDSAPADQFLQRARTAHPDDATIFRALVERTWQRRGPQDVIEAVGQIDPKSADPALLGYKAMALYAVNQPTQAASLLESLAARTDDASRAWSLVLQTSFGKDRPTGAAAIRKYSEALLRDPSNPVFPFLLGQAWASMGEVDQALRAWTDAAQRSPSWALPYCLISRTLSANARYPEALRAAELARQRAPGILLVESSYARAWYGLEMSRGATPNASSEAESLFTFLTNIQKTWKNDPDTLVEYVSMLARRGLRDRAIEEIRTAVSAGSALATDTLINLSVVSHDEHLGQENLLLAVAEKVNGPSVSIAFARAMLLIESGNRSEALTLFEAAARPHSSDITWQIAGARLLDATADAQAPRRWAEIGAQYPDNLQVQFAILRSPSHQTDRTLWRQTIDRIKAVSGTDSQLWQIEDARWHLSGQPSDTEVEALIAGLTKLAGAARSMPDVHQLLAEALLRGQSVGSVARAITELTIANDLRPGDFEITMKLAQLLLAQGARDRSGALVDAIAAQPKLLKEHRLWAAAMYADLGRIDLAIALVSGDVASDEPGAARDAMLAQLYRRAGRTSEAATEYQKILENASSSLESLAAGAEFYAAQSRSEMAEKFLARLDQLPHGPGVVEILRARVLQLAGQPDKAIATLAAAAQQHSKIEQIWQELSGAYIRNGKLDEAERAATSGIAAVPTSTKLPALRRQLARLRVLSPQEVGPLIDVISHDPLQPVAEKAMALLADGKSHNTPNEQVLASLRGLADQNSDFLPLQKLLAQRYAGSGRLRDATDIAARASAMSPDDIDAIRLLCAIQTASGNWEAARQSAVRWRQLANGNTLDADLAIARSDLRQAKPDPNAAVAQLAPYISDNVPAAAREAALPLYCNGLIGAGRTAEAEKLLAPLLPTSPRWKMVWLEMETSAQPNAQSATSWLTKFPELAPPTTPDEKVALADAWEQVGNRFDSPAAHSFARALLEPLIASPNVPTQAWPSWASINQAADNLPEAERAWRQYLKAMPGQPLAKNNLAYVLALEGGPTQLAEAEQLSREAIAAEPGISTLYDTLARVQLRAGKTDDALKSYRSALERNASNVDAMIGLADALESRPQARDEVKSLLTRIDAAVRDGAAIASPLRKQLDRVKTALSSSSL
jgi:predicted Zn-dependent protease